MKAGNFGDAFLGNMNLPNPVFCIQRNNLVELHVYVGVVAVLFWIYS